MEPASRSEEKSYTNEGVRKEPARASQSDVISDLRLAALRLPIPTDFGQCGHTNTIPPPTKRGDFFMAKI